MTDTVSNLMFWGGLIVAAVAYVLLQLERQKEWRERHDRQGD